MFEKESAIFEYCKNWASPLIDIVVAFFLTFYSPVPDPARFPKPCRYGARTWLFVWNSW